MKSFNIKNGLTNLKSSFKALKWYEWTLMFIMMGVAIYSMVCSFAGVNFITGKPDSTPEWLAIINFVSALCGVVCIFFTARASISNFAFAIVNTIVYIIYLAYYNIYGTLILEAAVYFPMNIASWIIWAKHRDNGKQELTKSRKMNWWQNLLTALAIASFTVISHFLLESLVGNSWGKIGADWGARELFTWLDATTFAIGVIAIFLEAFRFREQYVWWIVTDIVAVALYAIKAPFDPVYFTKKAIYLIMAVIGLINWIKLQKQRNMENK